MTITRHYPTGFNISIGVGKIAYAENMKEVNKALEHYFRNETTTGHLGKEKDCPLCSL